MREIYVISIFPELINNFINYGVLKKGQDKSLIKIEAINLRDFSDKNGYVDDKPYGGGAGMVRMPGRKRLGNRRPHSVRGRGRAPGPR